LALKFNNAFRIYIEPNFPLEICIAPTLFKRVVNNLISNALKHTTDGLVQVNISRKKNNDNFSHQGIELRHVGAEIQMNQEYLILEIVDNGVGIPADKLNHIFEEMNTDQEGGNWEGIGLGLPICLRLAILIHSYIL